jgi:hypothetical protein
MPNIGSSIADEKKKLFRALYGGLLFGKFKALYNGGQYYWAYQGKTLRCIKDIEGNLINIGQSQESALNNLFENGLVNNPDIVDQVNEYVDAKWEEAKEKWIEAERDENNELQKMKDSAIVKTITEFKFNIHRSFKTKQSWFTLLKSRPGLLLCQIIKENKEYFFEDLIDHLIEIFGPSVNTRKLCNSVLSVAKMKADTDSILTNYEDEKRFEPKDL